MEVDAAGAVESYFGELLFPRSQGLIAVIRMKATLNPCASLIAPRRADANGFVVCLGQDPFLEVCFEEGAIVLHVGYPRCLAIWDERKSEWKAGWGEIKPLPKKPKERSAAVANLATHRVAASRSIRFDLCDPESLGRAEFYAQTIITKIKYMVTNKKWYGVKPKDDLDFDDLIDAATRDYSRKVVAPTRRKKVH